MQCADSVIYADRPSELMVTMGYPKDEIAESLHSQKYDDVMATYLLLGRKAPEVCIFVILTSSVLNALSCDYAPHPGSLYMPV